MVLRKLTLSNLTHRRVRVALTVAAIALSVSLVVAVTSGYASVREAAYQYLSRFMGATDAQITRADDAREGIDQGLIDRIRSDPSVLEAVGRLETESGLLGRRGHGRLGRGAHVIGIQRPQDRQVEALEIEDGAWFDVARGEVAVIDQAAAENLAVGVGETITLPGFQRQLTLEVVGIVHKPGILASMVQTTYVPLQTLQEFVRPEDPARVTRILIELREGADADAFEARWASQLAAIDPFLRLRMAGETRREMDRNLQGVHMMSYLGGTVAMLAAAFIVFSALSMGVAERTRTLAMLRAVGTQRRQLGTLVVLEGLALAGAGVLLGVPLGWAWLQLLGWMFPKVFATGIVLSWGGIAFGSAGSLATALIASLLPAWSAMRVDPLEAMSPLAESPSPRVPLICVAVGLVLIAIDPILLYLPGHHEAGTMAGWRIDIRSIQFWGHFVVGLPAMMIGFFLLAPMLVRAVEQALGPVLAGLLRVRFPLLRQQLSGGIWRAAGTCAALMVGLAILVVMQTRGQTMLQGWRLPDRFPDIFIVAPPFAALHPQQQQMLADVDGIREVMPIAIATPGLGSGFFAIAGAAMLPDATMFLGIDPEMAFDMMELDFREGNAEEAQRLLRQGRHLIVTEEFRQLKGLGVGDRFPLKTPRHGTVDYIVAGVVWSPGIDVIVGMHDLGRQFDQRTAASVFGTLEDARRDFGIERAYVFAANLDTDAPKGQVLGKVRSQLGVWGLQAGDVRRIKHFIQEGLGRLLMLASTIAYAAMAVASLGVTNTIMASVRSRRWQFGVLRSVGVTRLQLLRLVLAEAVLLGMAGVILGLLAGAVMTLTASRMAVIIIGYNPPLVVPWSIIWTGAGIVMAVSLLASLWPAVTVARTQPLKLLQAGRASV